MRGDRQIDFKKLVENAKDLIFRMRIEDGVYQYVSPAAATITGYDCEEFYSTPFFIRKIVQPDWVAYYDKVWEKISSGVEAQMIEYAITDKSGKTRWLNERRVIICNDNGECEAIEAIISDVSARIKMEEEILAAKRNAEASNLAKTSFLANLSHELRTPLNIIIGFSDLLSSRSNSLSEKEQKWIQCISNASGHLLALIGDLLNLALIEMGKSDFCPQSFDAMEVIKETMFLHRYLALNKNISLQVELADSCLIIADRRRFIQILINLLTNALKFTSNGGSVGIIGRKQGDHLLVTVWDSGPGIAQENQKEIFEEFVSLNSDSQRIGNSAGLGLSIVKKYVELHSGKLWVESSPGQGSRFSFLLPLAVALSRIGSHNDDRQPHADSPSGMP